MKLAGPFRICMPLLALGAALVLAPQSRGQEVSPDHFEVVPNPPNAAGTAALVPAERPSAPPAAVHARNKKPSAHAAPVNSTKNLSEFQRTALVAVQDKRKVPASKP